MNTLETNNMSRAKDSVNSVNKLWHDFKEVHSSAETSDDKIDSVVLEQLNKINEAIETQQKRINELQTAFSRPEMPAHHFEKKSMNSAVPVHFDGNYGYSEAFCKYLRSGLENSFAKIEHKSLTQSDDSAMGYSITSKMSEQIRDLLGSSSVMRKLAKIDEISTDALELIEEREEIDSGWSQDAHEILEHQNKIHPSKKTIIAHELYAQPKVTQRLLDDPRIDVEEWISRKLIEVFSRKESQAFISGDGDGKPKGILSYPDGDQWGEIERIKSSEINADNIMQLFFSLKERYAANAKFLMSRSAVQVVRMLRDKQSGRYFWSPSADMHSPSTILGSEVVECPDMPEVKLGKAPIAFADFNCAYQIVDRPGIKVLRDPYTGKPYVKYYALKRVGGDVVNFDAIKLFAIS